MKLLSSQAALRYPKRIIETFSKLLSHSGQLNKFRSRYIKKRARTSMYMQFFESLMSFETCGPLDHSIHAADEINLESKTICDLL